MDDVGVVPSSAHFSHVTSGRNCDSLNLQPSRIRYTLIVDRNTDVQLGDRHVQSEISELFHARCDVLRSLATDKVRLEADTVKRVTLRKEILGDGDQGFGFVVDGLDVVVVDVELDVRGGRMGIVEL